MKVVKIFPSPHVEMRVSMSEQMETDMKECYRKSCAGEAGECEGCSWFEVTIGDTAFCEITELIYKVLGSTGKEDISCVK